MSEGDIAYLIGGEAREDLINEPCCECGTSVGYESELRTEAVEMHGENADIRAICYRCASQHVVGNAVSTFSERQIRSLYEHGAAVEYIATMIAVMGLYGAPQMERVMHEIAERPYGPTAAVVLERAAELLPAVILVISDGEVRQERPGR